MTRRLAFCCCAVVAILVKGAPSGLADGADMPITGAQVADYVNAAMAENGQSGSAIIAGERRYYPCNVPLQVAPRRRGRWDAVDVSCSKPLPWSIVVRTSADSTGEDTTGTEDDPVVKSAVVLKHSVRKGEVLSAKLLEVAEFETALAPGTYILPDELVGRRMAQSLGAGVPIRARHLELDWSVVEGGSVVIEINVGGLTVSTVGAALENGQIGDNVMVQNLRSGKMVRGVVTGEKKVSLGANIN